MRQFTEFKHYDNSQTLTQKAGDADFDSFVNKVSYLHQCI